MFILLQVWAMSLLVDPEERRVNSQGMGSDGRSRLLIGRSELKKKFGFGMPRFGTRCWGTLAICFSLILSIQQFGRVELQGLKSDLPSLTEGMNSEDAAVLLGTRTWSWLNRPVIHFHLGVPTVLLSGLDENVDILESLLASRGSVRVYSQYQDALTSSAVCRFSASPRRVILSFESFIKRKTFAAEMAARSETIWTANLLSCGSEVG